MDKLAEEIRRAIAEGLYTFYHVRSLMTNKSFQELYNNVNQKYANDPTFHARVNVLTSKIIKLISEREVK